jgi:Fe-S cluster assembly protein SufD
VNRIETKLPVGAGAGNVTEAERPGSPEHNEDAPARREANVAVMKTKAELALNEAYAAIADQLPGGPGVRAVREDAIGRFETLGLPHRRIEEWKYTDLRNLLKEALPPAIGDETPVTLDDVEAALGPLSALDADRMVVVNGAYRPDLSRHSDNAQVMGSPLAPALNDKGDGKAADLLRLEGRDGDAMLALNTAYATDGVVLALANDAKLAKPLLIAFVRAGDQPHLSATRNVISVGDGASATIIEAHVALPGAAAQAQTSTVTELAVGAGAEVTHVQCTHEAGNAIQLSHWLVDVGARANYRAFQLTSGTAVARNGLDVTFKGKDAKIDLSGAFLARGNQHIDTTLVVDHAVPACVSRELFKGVLEDTARGVFQGKVIVRPDAQKTDGKQMAQVLMLSPDVEFDSKPELEIYADDVVCGHGSTNADLDEDLLFYCRSRGIPEAEARALLIESFIGEALAQVEADDVREALTVLAGQWLKHQA